MFKGIIDNGADYCAGLPGLFDSEEAATLAGEEWLTQFYFDNHITTPEEQEFCAAGFDVEEVSE